MTRPASPDEPMQPVGGTISSGEPAPAARADVPSEELGTTGQFKAFANGEDTGAAERAAARPASERAAREASSGYGSVSASESTGTIQPPGLPPVRSDGKRGLYLALAVVVLVAVVITVLLLVL